MRSSTAALTMMSRRWVVGGDGGVGGVRLCKVEGRWGRKFGRSKGGKRRACGAVDWLGEF